MNDLPPFEPLPADHRALPGELLESLRSSAPWPCLRPVEVTRARALLRSGRWFDLQVADVIADRLLVPDGS